MKPKRFLVVVLALIAIGVLPALGTPRIAHATGNFVVNSSGDSVATDNFLTLREAIQVANGATTGPFTPAEQTQLGGCAFDSGGYITGGCGYGVFDNITFDPSITQVNLISSLPFLTDAGTWINGSAGAPRINASGMSSSSVFVINGNDITISNLSIVNGDPSGIFADVNVLGGKDARIAYNYLGTVPGAINCTPSGVTRNSYYGVHVWPNSSGSSGANNGVAYIYGNVISCHALYGVYVSGADWVYVGVQPDSSTGSRNYIGLSDIGYNLSNGGDGVYFEADGVDGVRYGFIKSNQIWNNDGNGIHLQGTGINSSDSTTLNNIQNNIVYANGQSGIRLTAGASSNSIGGGASADQNLIGWNGEDGISLLNSNNNLVQGNGIGVNEWRDRGNNRAGVYLENANDNTIAGNLISANEWAGVWAYNSSGNGIKNNKIGTNDTGTVAMANGHDGIALTNGSQSNTIGGTSLDDRNVISGNTLCGVRLRDGAAKNTIDYNLIGLNAAGTDTMPNGAAGICIFSGSNFNNIGTAFPAILQYISGNTREGIYIENSSNNSVEQSNGIGIATDNITPRGNGREGILISGGTNSFIRATLVAYNGLAGIAVVGDTATGNQAGPAQVRNNGGLPIDLGNDGPTPNGSRTPPGPNNWLNYPVITSASGTPVTISGTAPAGCAILIYRAIGNPAAPGGGGVTIGAASADVSGNWSATLPAGVGRHDVTLLALYINSGNSSEMSPRPVLYLPLIMR